MASTTLLTKLLHSFHRNKKNWIILVIILCLISIIAVKKFVYNDEHHYEEPLLSSTLNKIVEYGTTLHLLELKTQKILREDPYAKLVEEKLMPAHEKMQSIKKQTKIYEDMHRISGGPQNFMKTAFRTIEEVRRKIIGFEEEYYKISAEVSREVTGIDRDAQKAWNQAQTILTADDLKVTLFKGIFLDMPSRISSRRDSTTRNSANVEDSTTTNSNVNIAAVAVEQQDEFPKDEKRSFEEILESLSTLSELASKFEKVKTEFSKLIFEYNITEPEHIYNTPAFPLANELAKLEKELEIKIRDENYQAFIPFVRKYLKKLDDNLQEIQSHLARKRMRYENLAEMLETDQTNLKERIKKLKFSKSNDEF